MFLDRLEDFGCLDVWRLAALLFFVVVDGLESNQWWVLGCFIFPDQWRS
jgi:hypothetical protein